MMITNNASHINRAHKWQIQHGNETAVRNKTKLILYGITDSVTRYAISSFSIVSWFSLSCHPSFVPEENIEDKLSD